MSALAYQLPASRPEPRERHIEIVATRSQRRARPRLVYAIVTVAGLLAVLVAQLLLSIALSDGAYQIASLQNQQRELVRDAEALGEQINVLQSPQNLAVSAVTLGMVSNSSTAFLRLSDGAVLGSASAASAADRIVLGQDRTTLIPNALLVGSSTATATATTNDTVASESGVAASSGESTSVASTSNELPAVKTR